MSTVAELPRRAQGHDSGAARAAQEAEREPPVLKFMVVSVANLFIGTVLGVMQTFPGVSQWLRGAGAAGHLIDPLAHAHINLVGGVTMGMMGLFYYVLPRVLKRAPHSALLSEASFWLSAIGVGIFFTSLVILGLIEGNMVHAGMTYPQALEAVGPMHHVLIVTGAMLMGFGYWTFIANVFLTVLAPGRPKPTASPSGGRERSELGGQL